MFLVDMEKTLYPLLFLIILVTIPRVVLLPDLAI